MADAGLTQQSPQLAAAAAETLGVDNAGHPEWVRHDDLMLILTTRGSELCAPFGPICDNDDCECAHGLAGLTSNQLTTGAVTVADQDITLQDLTAICAEFMARTGWDEDGELAADMARLAVAAADGYPPGTRLYPSFDHATECWTFTPE